MLNHKAGPATYLDRGLERRSLGFGMSSDSFEVKFRRQLRGATPEIVRLAGELLCVYLLSPNRLGGSRVRVSEISLGIWLTYGSVFEDRSRACIRRAYMRSVRGLRSRSQRSAKDNFRHAQRSSTPLLLK